MSNGQEEKFAQLATQHRLGVFSRVALLRMRESASIFFHRSRGLGAVFLGPPIISKSTPLPQGGKGAFSTLNGLIVSSLGIYPMVMRSR